MMMLLEQVLTALGSLVLPVIISILQGAKGFVVISLADAKGVIL
jgi:hypothetical protein